MIVGLANQVSRLFVRKDPASRLSAHKKENSTTVPTRKATGQLSACGPGITTIGTQDDDCCIDDREANLQEGPSNPKDEKQKHSDDSLPRPMQTPQNPEDSIDERKKDCRDPQDSCSQRKVNRRSQRQRMSRGKFEAVAASIKLKEKNDLKEKRRKAYVKALGHSRVEFVDCESSSNNDGESFLEEFGAFLDDEQKELDRKEWQRSYQFHHAFVAPSNPENEQKKKSKKQTNKQNVASAPSLSPISPEEHVSPTTIRSLQRQYKSFAKLLPVAPEGSIFVRVPEDRLDLPRVLITGPHGTPYANGLFFFDCLMKDYPNSPPSVKFLTTGFQKVRFNPNLYNDGMVCLSLLGTWQGPGWKPGTSTLLQVLLSLQGLVLGTDKPFYNEPAYGSYRKGDYYYQESERYNKYIRKHALRWAILEPLRQIVLQEERVEARKEFLEKLKRQQQQEKKDSKMTGFGGEKEGDTFSSNTTTCPTTSPTTANANDEILAKTKKKKTKWSPISSLWSKRGPQNESTILLPSDMPPRETCHYPEFSTIIIQHFVESADYIEEQLQAWYQLDPKGTKKNVDSIRKLLKRLIDLVESRKQLEKESVNGTIKRMTN